MKSNKPRINMITKGSSKRQILVSMSLDNINKIMVLSNKYIVNINKALKKIRSEVMADFIQADNKGFSITTNKVISNIDLNIIEKYIKNIDVINSEDIMTSRLPQSKSYLKILDILYLIKDTNVSITSKVIEKVLQFMHIFNNVTLVSKPKIIKALSKLDIVVVLIDIWDVQSSAKAKSLINRYFNVGRYIATV